MIISCYISNDPISYNTYQPYYNCLRAGSCKVQQVQCDPHASIDPENIQEINGNRACSIQCIRASATLRCNTLQAPSKTETRRKEWKCVFSHENMLCTVLVFKRKQLGVTEISKFVSLSFLYISSSSQIIKCMDPMQKPKLQTCQH